MKRIHYASGTLVTGDAIADVLVRYAASLAANNAAADVHAPALMESGKIGDVQLLLGPASQILAEDEPGDHPELEDAEFVERYEKLVAALGPRRAEFVASGTEAGEDLDIDYL